MLYIFPYNKFSISARVLAKKLGVKRIKNGIKLKVDDMIINWGNSKFSENFSNIKIFNSPLKVKDAVNKLLAFKKLDNKNIPIPNWTSSKEEAREWIKKGNIVLGRGRLTGHSGAGIEVFSSLEGFEQITYPLYTIYKKKKKEFRVHVILGKVVDIQEKRRKTGEEIDNYIRSHKNGWVFCRDNIKEPESLRQTAIRAMKALELDFGGVDIIWNEKENKCYVLEVNTAPGLEGTTMDKYVEEFKKVK